MVVKKLQHTLEAGRVYMCRPHRMYAAALLRVGLGAVMFLFYATHFHERQLFWGPHGELDWAYWVARNAGPLNLFRLSSSPVFVDVLYVSATTVSLLFAVGFLPRVTAVAFACLNLSFFDRNWQILDGGQNVAQLLSVYLCFVDTSRILCIKTWTPRIAAYPAIRDGLAIVHNAGMLTIALQAATIYFWSGIYKCMGLKWVDGTALYYILRVHEFSLPGVSELIYHSADLVLLGTYSTLIFQLSFPYLMWNRRLKPILFALACSFHLAIAVLMGLVLFSATMIVLDVGILSDANLEAVFARLRVNRAIVVRDPAYAR